MIKPEKPDEFLCWCERWVDEEHAELIMLVGSAKKAAEYYAGHLHITIEHFDYLEEICVKDLQGMVRRFGIKVEETPQFIATEIKNVAQAKE